MIRIVRNIADCFKLNASSFNYFATDKGNKKKVQTVGFVSNNIEGIKNLSYKLKNPIKFTQGKFLIYKSQFSIFRLISDYIIYLAGIALFAYLIKNRVNFDIYPVIKHAYVGAIAILGFLMARRFLKNHNIVKQIYLLEGGKATQIIFQNQFKRQIFGEILQNTYYNSLFVTPADDAELKFVTLHQFPKTLEQLVSKQAQFGSYWKKCYSNDGNFILIPKKYSFINEQILCNVMNGKVIIF